MGDVSTAFITQFNKEVKHAYQQSAPKILQAIRTHRGVIGDTYTFQKLGSLTANTRSARNADLTALSPNHTKVSVTLSDYYAPVYLDDLDTFKANVDMRQEYVFAARSAIARKQDEVVVAALDAATMETGHSIAAAASGLTKAKILEAGKLLALQDVPPEERFIVVSPAQIEDALNTAEVSNTDYGIASTMQGLLTGTVNNAFGFNWIISNELTLATTTRQCYAFSRSAVAAAVGADITTKINYSVDKDAHLILSKTSLGVSVVDTFGIVQVDCTE